jgi:penicillin-binding protein 1A
MLKKIIIAVCAVAVLSVTGLYLAYVSVKKSLPEVIRLEDYKPLLVSSVYDRNGKKAGEFFRERRTLVPYNEIPTHVVQAFLAAEDDQFFEHHGIDPQALFRAAITNMRAGRNVQGGSTITQQVAKTLLLNDNKKTFTRKIRDILLAIQMEKNLSKEDILYLYLNQIYFGQGAYGIEMASQSYFRKPAKKLTVPEAAILAGLPKAPSDFSPTRNPVRAKERQVYVLKRMAANKFITEDQESEFIKTPLTVYLPVEYDQKAPFYMETIRQLLAQQLGEEVILDQGVKIIAALDLDSQQAANEAVKNGLKELDKRQGFRGAEKNISDEDDRAEYLLKEKKKLISDSNPERTILPDGSFAEVEIISKKGNISKIKNKKETKLPSFFEVNKSYKGIVKEVNDDSGYVIISLPDSEGIIDFETMTWARKVNFEVRPEYARLKKPSAALTAGDVIDVKLIAEKFAWSKSKNKKTIPANFDTSQYLNLELDQEPLVEGSLLSIDQTNQDVLAMVGGYSFARNEYNRALQAARQTGSSFKAIVYAAALEKNYNPSTRIIDAPIVFKESITDEEGQGDEKIWRPSNHGHDFSGEITMRNALVKSLNIPSVKIMEDIGVNDATEFARRLGIFSKLNPDFTLVLGSSSLTLYEMTKVFSEFGRAGKRTRPIIVKKVTDQNGKVLLENLSLEARFLNETEEMDLKFEEKRTAYLAERQTQTQSAEGAEPTEDSLSSHLYFNDPEQLIRPETAYVITDMLRGTVTDPNGTGGRAAQLGRDTAGKTGTTNGYVDGWFIGYTPNIATGVWVGFDQEKTIGKGEVGGKSALPIWLEFMKAAHEKLPVLSFLVPKGVKVVKIDSESGQLANSASGRTIEQAYIDGTEPTAAASRNEESNDFLKQDLDN